MRSSWILHHRNRIWDQCLTARWMMWGTGTWMSWSIGFSYIQNCLRAKNRDSAVLPWLSYTSGYTFSRRFALFRCFRARTIANLNHVIMWFVFFWDITMADGFISYIAGVPHLVYISSMTFFFFLSLSLSPWAEVSSPTCCLAAIDLHLLQSSLLYDLRTVSWWKNAKGTVHPWNPAWKPTYPKL